MDIGLQVCEGTKGGGGTLISPLSDSRVCGFFLPESEIACSLDLQRLALCLFHWPTPFGGIVPPAFSTTSCGRNFGPRCYLGGLGLRLKGAPASLRLAVTEDTRSQ